MHDPLGTLNIEDAATLSRARDLFQRLERETTSAALGARESTEAMDLGRFIEAAGNAADGIFDALNVASSHCDSGTARTIIRGWLEA